MKWIITVLGVSAFIAFAVFFVRSRGGETITASELDRTIVAEYIRDIAEGQYDEAYRLLSKGYRSEVPLEKFRTAHERRRREKGTVRSYRMLRDQVIHTLFSSRRDVLLMYEVFYGNRRETAWIKLEEDETGSFSIEGTYHENAAETLDFVLW